MPASLSLLAVAAAGSRRAFLSSLGKGWESRQDSIFLLCLILWLFWEPSLELTSQASSAQPCATVLGSETNPIQPFLDIEGGMEGRCCNCSPCTGPAVQIRLNCSLCYFCVPFSWFGKARGDEIISPRGKQSIFITPEVSWVPILFLVFFLSCSRQEYDFGSHFLLSPASQKNVI